MAAGAARPRRRAVARAVADQPARQAARPGPLFAFAEHGLDGWEFDVLAALRRAGDPYELTPGQLVAETLVTSGTMTTRVDRLIGRGLVLRRPDPRDRRGVLVQLTPSGRDVVDGALSTLLTHEQRLVAALSPKDRAVLPDMLRRLLLVATNYSAR